MYGKEANNMATNVNATSSSTSTYKINAIAGMNSGLDTEAIVNAQVSNIQNKIDTNKQDTQVYEWKQEKYRAITEKLENFYNDNFLYSSSKDSIMNSNFFNESYARSSSSAVTVSGDTKYMKYTKIQGGSIQLATNSSVTSSKSISGDISKLTFADMGVEADANGNYSMTLNGKSFSFSADTTLKDAMNEINRADVGVDMLYSSATGKFTFVSEKTGSESAIELSGSAADAMMGVDRQNNIGQDFKAMMSFDGTDNYVEVVRSSNEFSLDGVNYKFNDTSATDITFESGTDTDKIIDKVKKFVEEYNSIMKSINDEIYAKRYGENVGSGKKYPPLTEAQKEQMSEKEIEQWTEKAKTGLLRNDSTLTDIASRLRSAMTNAVGSSGLYNIGIDAESWTSKGVLKVDENKLRAAIEEDPEAVSNIFGGENGVASRVKNTLTYAVKGTGVGESKGVLVDLAGSNTARTSDNTISRRISSLKTNLTALETKLDSKKEYWWKKFSALESYISSMNSQSSFLSSFGS